MDRYLLRGTFRPFAATLSVLVALFAGYSLAGILADAVSGLLPVGVIAALAGLKVLIALDVLIPVALFIAVVTAFGRLQADCEMTALQALGISPLRLARPILVLALGLAFCVACLSLFIRPLAYAESHTITERASAMLNVNAMRAGTFYASNNDGQVIFLGDRPGRSTAQGVFVTHESNGGFEVIYAQHAEPAVMQAGGQRVVHLSEAHIYKFDLRQPENDQVVEAAGMNVDPDGAPPASPGYSPVAASSRQLAGSQSPVDIAELQWRISTGISTLLLAFLGVTLGRGGPRQNRYGNFGTAILAYSAYYLICTTARSWVQHGQVGEVPGLFWAPAGLAIILAVSWHLPTLRAAIRRLGFALPVTPRPRAADPASG